MEREKKDLSFILILLSTLIGTAVLFQWAIVTGLYAPLRNPAMWERLMEKDALFRFLYVILIVGFVFQSYNLIPHQSVLSNVELALTLSGVSKQERRRRACEALEQVGLKGQEHKRPNQMSGGQMQRVAIARALVNNPDILLADEPTGALDSETGTQVMELLKKVAKDRLVIMVTHNAELAEQYATRIVKLHDGRISSDTNPVSNDERTLTKERMFLPGTMKKRLNVIKKQRS